MAGREGCAVDDAALLLGPGLAVRVGSAGILGHRGIRAGWRQLPAISKLQHVTDHRLAACGEVIDGVVIKVPTQATDLALELRAESEKDAGLLVPQKHQANVGFHHQVVAHLMDEVGGLLPHTLLDHLHLAVTQFQLIAPQEDLDSL